MENKPTKKLKKTGLFFGSFNPIHIGHMAIINYMVEFSDLAEVWLVVSPHNPLKERKSLLPDYHRLALVHLAIEDDPRFRAIDLEFHMPRPSYTIDTLVRLEEKYPDRKFVLIAGTDVLPTFHKWKNYKLLLENYQIYIYNRPNYDPGPYSSHPGIRFFDAPLMEVSSTFIRNAARRGKDVRHFMPEKVAKYVREMHFYEK